MKVLIISHNPLSTYQNMGKSMLALFDQFDSTELCQLYIYPSVPDVEKCNSYYRMTDKDILRSYYKFRVKGAEVAPDVTFHKKFSNAQDEKLYNNRKNQNSPRKLARDLMWKFSRWYNKELQQWLDKEQPDRIFLAPGDARFIYDIALKISRRRNIPIITYICDDYYFVKKARPVLDRVHQRLLHKKMDALFSKTSHILTICEELKIIYSKKFKVPATTIMTGTNYPISEVCVVNTEPHSITYMGNIGLKRYVSLIDIGRALDEINNEFGTDYSLNIYTSSNDPTVVAEFEKIKSISLCGYVSGNEFNRVFHSSELLLHTEGFGPDSVDRVKYSVSTKIADSMGSGIPMIAYGPDSVSSMKHLIRNDAAVIITSQELLKKQLLLAFRDKNMRKRIAENGLKTALKFHDSRVTSLLGHKIMEEG